MRGMPDKLMVPPKPKVPATGEDADPAKKVGGRETSPKLPDRDGPAKRDVASPAVHQAKPPATGRMKGVDIKGMRASLARMK